LKGLGPPIQNGSILSSDIEASPMKTAAVAATAIMALLVVGLAATIYARSAGMSVGLSGPKGGSTAQADDNDNNQSQAAEQEGSDDDGGGNDRLNLKVGQTITIANLTGSYESATNSSIEGDATGSVTLQVSQVFNGGLVLTITSGTFSVAGISYTVTGGTLELGPSGEWASGTGTTSGSGQFLIHIGIDGTSTTNPNARVVLDLKAGGSEFLVSLGSQGVEDNDADDLKD